ncbi:unnamed protein product [Cuscuta europaea]|uniref:TF-B3 domain-containing protein n=2 Tax=Cuscuta europaea TaxID=41803 RepID=A0A9P0YLG5_CUSEU|nr:unnamed protein product [Cuscuta europaea]
MASIQNGKFSFHRCFCPQNYSQKMEIPISYMDPVHRDSMRKTLPKKIFVMKKLEKIDIKKEYHMEETYTKVNGVAGDDANDGASDGAGDGVDDGDADDGAAADDDYIGGSGGGDEGDEDEEEEVPHLKRRRHKRNVGAEERISRKETKDVPDHYGVDIFKSGHYTQPTNPYFVAGIRSKRRNDLYIPRDVIKDIVLPPTIILRDPRGKEWIMKAKVWADGRTWMSGGWMNLCRRNLVEKNDRLICEFLPREEGKDDVVLQVTAIIREGDF